jgi:hypothetical protein
MTEAPSIDERRAQPVQGLGAGAPIRIVEVLGHK